MASKLGQRVWRRTQISDDRTKLILYEAFVEGKLKGPRSLVPEVHQRYFDPQYPEFSARSVESLKGFHQRIQKA